MSTVTARTQDAVQVEWERWHAAREADLATDHGWLSLTGFAWLTFEPSPIAGLPGQWWADGERAYLGAVSADGISVDGQLVDGIVTAEVAEGGSLIWAHAGQVHVELLRRDGTLAIRTRDPQAATLRSFTGVPVFEHDLSWRLVGQFTLFPQQRNIQVRTARPDLRQTFAAVGDVRLSRGADTFTLLAARTESGGLRIPFRDGTSGSTTAAWRVVTTEQPQGDGAVTVDFNRAVNLPFAFSPHGTCPAPPEQNSTGVQITAGERAPR
ncbi:DUF1684 domain-containing protein [Dermacoccaceae bacterium W4C1]